MSDKSGQSLTEIVRELMALDLEESVARGDRPPQFGWRTDQTKDIMLNYKSPSRWERLRRRFR